MVLRKNKKSKIKISLIVILIFIFFSINAINSLAQMQPILIDVRPKEVNENDYFKVSAYVINESEEIEVLIYVNIIFDNETYIITEQSDNYEINIKAPQVDKDTQIPIYASKDSYLSGYETVYVKNIGEKVLRIVPNDFVISAGETFYVTVYEDDTQYQTVEGATVYISNQWDNVETTNDKGIAFLKAPDKGFEEIRIIANKEGYVSDSIYIRINLKEDLLTTIINNKNFIIFIAVLMLLFSVLFVHFKQKKNVYVRAKEISNQKIVDKYTSDLDTSHDKNKFESQGFVGPSVRFNQGEDSKVEEIRISRPRKEKEVVDVKLQKDETQEIIDKKKTQRRDYDWFEGTDEIRYEIDKLTGEIDEDGIDKWFEGIEDIKKKIDDKMKKKKQNQQENDK